MIRLAAQRASRSSPSEHDSFRLSPGCRGGFVGPIARSETTDLLARTARADHPPSSESTGHRFDATTISAESTDHAGQVCLEAGEELFVGRLDGGPADTFTTTYMFEANLHADGSEGRGRHRRRTHNP
jgi:hypothetical protein